MALGDRMAWLFSQSSALSSINFDEFSSGENGDPSRQTRESEAPAESDPGPAATSLAYLPQAVFLREFRHEGFEEYAPMKPSQSVLVSKWRPKDRMKTSCVALVMCLNIGVDPPDVIKISPCARMECWIDCFSSSWRLHTQREEKVVGIGFLPELDQFKIVSASQAGDIQFLDIRNHSEAYLTIDAHRGSLTAFAIHRHAPVIANGSSKQIFKVFSLDGDQLSIIKYYPTLMAQRIGSVNCLNFHPYKVLLAAGAADACVSIYADDNYEAR